MNNSLNFQAYNQFNLHRQAMRDSFLPKQSTTSGVILSGGNCARHGGKNKAMIDICGQRIIVRIYHVMKSIFKDLILVTNDPDAYSDLDVRIVKDIYGDRSALTGLHAGLDAAMNTHAFFVACDAPLIKKELIKLMLKHWHPEYDALVPKTSAGMEPLFAVYSKRCLPFIEHHLDQKKYKIMDIYNYLNVANIDESILREHDSNLSSFFNVNTPDMIDAAKSMVD
ncbi:MAG: molybdenum cofactor guanylyltransferase [Proteobacteria bacterium]|nr:molybdenum cofactor guanylyltransferase [Pseudomonadota bacterium]